MLNLVLGAGPRQGRRLAGETPRLFERHTTRPNFDIIACREPMVGSLHAYVHQRRPTSTRTSLLYACHPRGPVVRLC